MAIGKLYTSNGELSLANVEYQFQDESPTSWWGELTLTEYKRISDSGSFIIELEDNRKGRCYLKKRVNRAVTGVPPRYIYRFNGTGPLE